MPDYRPGVGGWGVTLIGALVFSCNLLYCVLIIEKIIIIVEKINYTSLKIKKLNYTLLLLTIKNFITKLLIMQN